MENFDVLAMVGPRLLVKHANVVADFVRCNTQGITTIGLKLAHRAAILATPILIRLANVGIAAIIIALDENPRLFRTLLFRFGAHRHFLEAQARNVIEEVLYSILEGFL